jgi:L,D-peptidoglycan transpeptidase YkuD (ErfK/YbiS/YcfS/YnhG family)
MNKYFGIIALSALAALFAASCSKSNDIEDYQDFILNKYESVSSVKQLVYVECLEGSNASVSFYKKDSGGNWETILCVPGYIGKNGCAEAIDSKVEGDGKTPIGDFGVKSSFGIAQNPGTTIPYLQATDDYYGCDENCQYYNQIISASQTGHKCAGEHLIDYTPNYQYAIFLDYNKECVYGKGSLIFLHCIGPHAYTGGCVAVDKESMKKILQECDVNARICIFPKGYK